MSDERRTDATTTGADPGRGSGRDEAPFIGRYRVEGVLGEGAFGKVYLARDEELRRRVAIKVPHRHRISRPEDTEAYLREARVLASLDHPHIVPVYDVGTTADGLCYVVSKFIEGRSLAARIGAGSVAREEAAALVASVAEALHQAHKRGLVHRDVKPANILLDEKGEAYVCDFGLALREEDLADDAEQAGTPAYMSPEQVRGEWHLVDGRSDVFSLGIVLYELLAGRRPFTGGNITEVLQAVTAREARPPRQVDETIPRELERICLRALAKRASDRYTTAHDLAEDLRHWLSRSAEGASASARLVAAAAAPAETTAARAKIVPKGLRSFEAADADFFLELLPGPRDRNGLPESIRFWKRRIEEKDPEETFRVGVIYGPSGCGKSSLVKAGLLPRLSGLVVALYLEATPQGTEERLARALGKRCRGLPSGAGLAEIAAAIRRGEAGRERKVLVVLDQFEQWLHGRRFDEEGELVRALRQCDGARLQCLILVRDDFWLALTRFLQALEIELLSGENAAVVDLFDPMHACKVLAEFGRAYGRLLENLGNLTGDERAFLNEAVEGMAEEGRVVPVRLSLFAEMVKGKPWTPATLREVGGAAGVGVAFLEEAFGSRAAQPRHRLHEKAARAVLKALLPEAGTDIRGGMRSRGELLETSGYAGDEGRFEDLLRVLDGELRLLTPTDPEGTEGGESARRGGARFFQLTHDYLVPSLREWLTRKQKETFRGRMGIRLEERAALWKASPVSRQLPAWWEFLGIDLATRKRDWTETQSRMMRRAGRFHAARAGAAAVVLAGLAWGGLAVRDQARASRAEDLVARLADAEIEMVPEVIRELEPYRRWANPLLRAGLEREGADSPRRLRYSLALLRDDYGQVDYLLDRMLVAGAEEFPVLREALRDHAGEITGPLWEKIRTGQGHARFRAACALAAYDPESERWSEVAPQVAARLVAENPIVVGKWVEALRPVRARLVDPLVAIFRDPARSEGERSLATEILADYARDRPDVLGDLLLDADSKRFAVLYRPLASHGDRAAALLEAEMEKRLEPRWEDPPLDRGWPKPDNHAVKAIEDALGFLDERFAFCQTMPLEEFARTAERLRAAGYRPSRFRPYSAGDSLRVAAIWTRDGRDFEFAEGLSAEDLLAKDEEWRAAGFQPVDVQGYLAEGERYAALWVAGAPEARISLGDRVKGHVRSAWRVFAGEKGERKIAAVWEKPAEGTTGTQEREHRGPEGAYSGDLYPGELQVDVSVTRSGEPPTGEGRFEAALAELEKGRAEHGDHEHFRLERAAACMRLGRLEEAAEDLSWLIEKSPKEAQAYRLRAIVLARLGRSAEAREDVERYAEATPEPAKPAWLDCVVSAFLGEEGGAERFAEALSREERGAGDLYDAACAFAIASEAALHRGEESADRYADRSLALLREAVKKGYSDLANMAADPDLDGVRKHPGYATFWKEAGGNRAYEAVWRSSPTLGSAESHGLDPKAHLAGCRELALEGFLPASIAVAEIEAGEPLVTASVWHRPLVPEKAEEVLASRQANAAAALLKMGRPEKAWSIARHSPDPTARSFFVHRVSPLGVEARAVLDRLDLEDDVSTRRALLLALGEFAEDALPLSERESLIPRLRALYRDDPDPGIHGVVEWLLRQWEKKDMAEAVTKEMATGKVEGERGWYVTTGDSTMVVIRGPVEFDMGSRATETQRRGGETLHRRRIPRSFAIGQKEVTVEEFERFAPRAGMEIERWAPDPACPILAVTWYRAAEYCNWLSKEEGIPEDEWCYEPNGDGRYAEGMRLKPNWWERTGYRLPTEAEWEFACRAGAVTSRYYGLSQELLGKYAWYFQNSNERSWPAGTRKPNDFGLFDVLGNVMEWCQDEYGGYAPGSPRRPVEDLGGEDSRVIDRSTLLLRGGAFINQPSNVRSADRLGIDPSNRNISLGFRAARTYP